MDPTLVDADPDAGFHYPYYLAAPDEMNESEPTSLLVESSNVPAPTDDFEAVRRDAQLRASRGFGRRIADELGVPFLHPVFARPWSDPVDWTHYTHSLDRQTLQIEDPPLERIDRQLLAMVEDARDRLEREDVEVSEQILLNGFSASGTFANRFAALHPDRVRSVTAGGINGMPILPIETADGPDRLEDVDECPTPYPVGIADLAAVTGEAFDLAAFREVDQFLYLGTEDDNDTLLYPDAWTDPEVRFAAVLVYGEDIHRERFPRSRAVYEEMDVPAVFRTYEGTGHDPVPAFEDVVAFHERSLAGEDVDELRSDLGGID